MRWILAAPLALLLATIGTSLPVADAEVQSANPNVNYGSSQSLYTDGSPIRNSYLRFSVSESNPITSAKLRIYAYTAQSVGFDVRTVSDNSWSESTITYANAPAYGPVIGSSGPIAAGTWLEVDVSSVVSGNGLYSFALTTSSTTNVRYASREDPNAALRPQLVVTTGSPPPPSSDLAFPIRGVFYYPWFPETWGSAPRYPFTHYHPVGGFYSITAAKVTSDVAAMKRGGIKLGIASWWGQGSLTDSRVATLLANSSNFEWTLYYEREASSDPSAATIQADLDYIAANYANHQAYLHLNGKPVIFVYAGESDGCGMVDRWKNTTGFYIVLKVFSGFASCANQPDSWHQYSPAVGLDEQAGFSVSISPGFWLGDQELPRFARDRSRFEADVKRMAQSAAPWHLITTYNEWGEGTAIEDAVEWGGFYLDILGANPDGTPPPPPPPPPGDIVIMGAGDIACPPGLARTANACHQADTAALLGPADAVFTLGDNQYDVGALADFNIVYNSTWGQKKSVTYPAPGNHDYNTSGASGYFTYFGNRAPAPYYSYDLGNWHLISLNSEIARTTTSPQVTWLRNDLAATTKPCVAAYWHRPRFTSGSNHGPDSSQQPFVDALYDANADLILEGHNHQYERFAPLNKVGQIDPIRGIRHFIVGTGGRNLYSFAAPAVGSEVRYNGGFGVLKLTLHSNSYDFQFLSEAGKTFTDSGTTACH